MRILPLIMLLFFSPAPRVIFAGDSVFSDESVRTVAKSSLAAFLGKIPLGHESRYGFLHRDEFTRAIPGTPLRVYTAYPDSLNGDTGNPSDHPVARNEWRIPVLVDGKSRSLLTVASVDGVLKAVELGGAALAREFGEFDRKYPGSRRALFRLDRLKCDFLMLDRTGAGLDDGEYHPLHSARLVFNVDAPSPRSRSELFGEIHRRCCDHRSADR
ncbi:MAG: hypothetical protein JW913_15825 [Chitinispirillaceae bacterium]|nr:hypothetical protein [Chitinispirillaceae bacterium]